MLPILFLSRLHSNSKWDPVNFELPETRVCLEKFIFTYPWFLSALGELKHLVILAKALSILPPSCAQVSGPWVFTRHSSAGWKGKKKYPPPKKNPKLQVTLLHCFVQALVSVFSCAIIRLPCFALQVLPPLPAGCQLLASTESLKAVHLFGDWQVAQRVKKPINLQQEV